MVPCGEGIGSRLGRRRASLPCLVRAGLFATALLAGCQGEPTTITGTIGAPRPSNPGGAGTGSASSSADARLVGRWSRTILFQDDVGSVHASRTTWRFGSDASATRSVVATNLTFGMVDSVVTPARWRTEGGAVVLTYLPEGRGIARFDYFFQGTVLILGGIAFDRQ